MSLKRVLVAFILVGFTLSRVSEATVLFGGGSLIIPMQASYQTDCGVASAYGLVYQILNANNWLQNHGYNRIVVHWAFSATKGSPNRCVPTNLDVPPVYGSYTSANPPPWNDPNWNDGCDFSITDTTATPVLQVNNANPVAANDTQITTYATASSSVSTVYPTFSSHKIQATSVNTTDVNTVQYMGGPFIISASDAPTVQALLSGSIIAYDSFGNAISFSQFTTNAGKCTGSTGFDTSSPNHYVNIHRAQTSFSAQDNISMSGTPPRVALLATDKGSGGVDDGILEPYLTSAGLNFSKAAGCPTGGINLGSSGSNYVSSTCPNGRTPGQIYDLFDVSDFNKGLQYNVGSNNLPLYQVIWTPHWTSGGSNDNSPQTTPTTTEVGAAEGISQFVNNANTGLFAECASIATYEGAMEGYLSTNTTLSTTTTKMTTCTSTCHTTTTKTTSSTITISTNATNWTLGNPQSQNQTCVSSSAGDGTCDSVATTNYGVNQVLNNAPYEVYLPNCSDPTATSGESCEYYPIPGDAFMQIGDYEFFDQYGYTQNYLPNQITANSQYVPGTLRLAYNVINDNPTTARAANANTAMLALNNSDMTTRNFKNNNPGAGQTLYLAGHTYDAYVAGTRIVLGTLLLLGLVYSAEETGYTGPTYYNSEVFVPTYNRVVTTPSSGEVKTFNPLAGSHFLFPYHSGDVRTHQLSQLSQGNETYNSEIQYDAQQSLPGPQARNIFTYLGGTVSAPATTLPTQSGWTPVNFDVSNIQSPASACLDVFSIGQVAANSTTDKRGPYLGMVPGADGVCDLEESLAQGLVLTASMFGTDYGSSEWTTNKAALLSTANGGAVQSIEALIQLVRGFCFATSTSKDGTGSVLLQPTGAQCNYHAQADTATLGGFVHSQIAVVPASAQVTDGPSGKHRPTVAYTGSLDGQLHAFYVPSDGNDSGYTGPANTLHYPNSSATSAFNTPLTSGGSFTPPNALTELWSFIPPGQLPLLYSNNAQVDSAPAVLDVFGDFTGTGIREWHTVLVASAGGQNREIFAIDVTNPLAPVMLWDIESTFDPTLMVYAPTPLMDDNTGQYGVTQTTLPDAQAFGWNNHVTLNAYNGTASCNSNGDCPAPATCNTGTHYCSSIQAASFLLPPQTDPGRYVTGMFNYQSLGASQSVSAALLRRNNIPVFAAFVATNQPGGNGMFTFAIDITSGRKLWEFNNPYDKQNDPAGMASILDNTAPAGVTLWSRANSTLVDTAFVGDLEGSLWEIDVTDGLNLTSYNNALSTTSVASSCTKEGSCNFPLAQAFGYDPNGYPQAITTESTLFVVPTDATSTSSPFHNYIGQTLLAFGTAGTDATSALVPAVTGTLDILPLTGNYSLTPTQIVGPPTKYSTAYAKGVGTMITGYPEYVTTGERLYGSITAAGDHLYFATTSGTVNGIDSRGSLGGSTYSVDLTAAANSSGALLTLTNSAGGAAGTILVAPTSTSGQVEIITVTDQSINVSAPQTPNLNAPVVNGVGQTPSGFLGWFFRSTGDEF
jgi:type IV pilus assembly protein PilY1